MTVEFAGAVVLVVASGGKAHRPGHDFDGVGELSGQPPGRRDASGSDGQVSSMQLVGATAAHRYRVTRSELRDEPRAPCPLTKQTNAIGVRRVEPRALGFSGASLRGRVRA